MKEVKVGLLAANVNNQANHQYYLDELQNLCSAINFTVLNTWVQNVKKIDNKTYLGPGKLLEVAEQIKEFDLDLIITLDELSGSQNKHIEEVLAVRVMDRTQLILEIFSVRAQTKEAKLQVSIAQLKYNLPRMVGSYEHLSRSGGGKVGTVARGSGEKKIEIDRRVVRRHIQNLEEELESLLTARNIQRQKRVLNRQKIVSIVGYTNAGKSTLMNLFVKDDLQVFEKDMLFATLDTSVRNVQINKHENFLLVDTVGFVSRLPHELVKAFRSTLEEIAQSDLIIHLHDSSSPFNAIHSETVLETLELIGVKDIPIIDLYNKADLLSLDQQQKFAKDLLISANDHSYASVVIDLIKAQLFNDYQQKTLLIKYDQLRILDAIHSRYQITRNEPNNEGIEIDVLLDHDALHKYQSYIKK